MVDTCTCNNECSSMKQGFKSLRIKNLPKKLLVAISLVLIVTMCLTPAEAASISRRHRQHGMKTKETGASRIDAPLKEHKRRHDHLRNGASTKEHGNPKRSLDIYEKAQKDIESKMAYTKEYFDKRRRMLKAEVHGDYGSGKPDWLPKTNFVEIHFHKYNLKNESLKSRRIFEFLIRKLYKSLLEYHQLFKRFIAVQAVSPDSEITRYNVKRTEIFNNTINDLYSVIGDIQDKMTNKTKWQNITANPNRTDRIELKVDGAKYLKNDDILLRAYGNLLDNWHLEFNCSKVRDSKSEKVSSHRCKQYEQNLRKKRNKRRRRKQKKENL